MSWSSEWSTLGVLIILLLNCGILTSTTNTEEPIFLKIIVPASHTALSGDLTVFILESAQGRVSTASTDVETGTTEGIERNGTANEESDSKTSKPTSDNPLVLRVLFLDGLTSELIGEFPLETLPHRGENISVIIPCGFFSRGGTYTLQLQYKYSTVPAKITDIADLSTIQMSNALNVKWPTPSLFLESQHFTTYPNQPISATLRYSEILCEPSENVPMAVYTLQLIYCGSSTAACDPQNKNRAQVLYYEEVKGFIAQKIIVLQCEYFGLAGDYALRLKASPVNPNAPTTSAYIKVDWSDEFVFNVHAKSIYPCEGSAGIPVIFEYPSCRLQGDRVRVYGRLRADVRSLAPPSTLHYIAELKAVPGKHTLTFDCDIFTEKFIEYCFVYVSQAITGAMAEVKISCIPTFSLQENDAGGWGPWSPWTPCSSSCIGGTRNRYRFCDTPPPKYGAKFCQGKAVETESCGGSDQLDFHDTWDVADWECHHGRELVATRPEVAAKIGSKCRCGCVISLGEEIPRKMLAANTQACPGRSFWLLQTRSNFVVRLHLDQAQFPCPGQYFRVRDGDSLNADLLTDIAFDKALPSTGTIISSSQSLLLEFFSDEVTAAGESCVGGFLAHAAMLYKRHEDNRTLSSVPFEHNSTSIVGPWMFWMTPAHLAAASLLIFIFFISVSIALQFAFKYRKYQIAEDLDNLNEYSGCSESMIGLTRRVKAISSTTLISEVVSLVGLPRRKVSRHAKLQASPCDVEDGYDSSETQAEYEDESSVDSKTEETQESCSQKTIIPSKESTAEKLSTISNVVVVAQPEVKYARPVKLRTLGTKNSALDQTLDQASNPTLSIEENRLQSIVNVSSNNARIRRYNASNPLQGKELPPVCIFPNVTTLRGGKESKDRRNRERLLQGPGSEFSLTNPEMDLELDYYDYNVANAGAAPGSYLGMDPAFLVWIPPLSSENCENIPLESSEDRFQEGAPCKDEIESRLTLDTEGATLTPSEYRRLKLSKIDEARYNFDSCSNLKQSEDECLKKSDSRGNIFFDESASDGKMKLCERLLPIHRILEDSRIRVSEESLSGQALREKPLPPQNIIPNRLHDSPDLPDTPVRVESEVSSEGINGNRLSDGNKQLGHANSPRCKRKIIPNNNIENADVTVAKQDDKSSYVKPSAGIKRYFQGFGNFGIKSYGGQKAKGTVQEDKRNCYVNEENLDKIEKYYSDKVNPTEAETSKYEAQEFKEVKTSDSLLADANVVSTMQYKYKDFNHFTQPCEKKRNVDPISIPMMELSRSCLKSPAKVHKQIDNRRIILPQEEVLSPDYGVETDMKDDSRESFYDLIHEAEAEIKFADDDEEYIDNKINV